VLLLFIVDRFYVTSEMPVGGFVAALFPSVKVLAPLMGTFFTIGTVVSGILLIGSVTVLENRMLGYVSVILGILTILTYPVRFYGPKIGSLLGLDPAGVHAGVMSNYLIVVPALAAAVLFSIVAGARLNVSIPDADAVPAPDAPASEAAV